MSDQWTKRNNLISLIIYRIIDLKKKENVRQQVCFILSNISDS